jgi:hypothetical protein
MSLRLISFFFGFFPEQSKQPIIVFLNQAQANKHKKGANMKAKLLKFP